MRRARQRVFVLGFDGMEHRLVRGTTDWKRYEVILDVPEDSTGISFGLMLIGGGSPAHCGAWIDDVELGLATAQDAVTQAQPPAPGPEVPKIPVNLSFEL